MNGLPSRSPFRSAKGSVTTEMLYNEYKMKKTILLDLLPVDYQTMRFLFINVTLAK